MKKFQFLLLDAGPIIKLFELGIWEKFIECCDVTTGRIIAENETVYANKNGGREYIEFGLKFWEEKGLIKIIDLRASEVLLFCEKILQNKYIIHPGEKEILAFLYNSSENYKLCAADQAVFRVLGYLGKGSLGISLEEILKAIGLSKGGLEWQYTKEFRQRFTQKGQIDSVQN